MFVFLHFKDKDRICRSNKSDLIVFALFMIDFVVKMMIINVSNFLVGTFTELSSLIIVQNVMINKCYFLDRALECDKFIPEKHIFNL